MKGIIKIFLVTLAALVASVTVSCTKDSPQKDESPYSGLSLTLSDAPEDFGEGQTATMTVSLEGNTEGLPVTYAWQSSRPSVVTVEGNGESAELTAVKEGHAVVYAYIVEAPDIIATVDIEVRHVSDNIVRILAIGNSFSQDAVEQYLYELFRASGQEVIIGNLYIGGCTLQKHFDNIQGDKAAYEYRKVVDGVKTNTKSFRISAALAEESWDYVSIQQASDYSGVWEQCSPYLSNIISYLRDNTRKDTKILWHSTWAYASGSNHSAFPNYQKDQMVMYNAIVDVARKVMDGYSVDILVPSGTAVQNGRTSVLGDTFNRDGYHLETTYGRYTAACTWFEAISGKDVTENVYAPSTVDAEKKAIAQLSAHNAVLSPYSVTPFSSSTSYGQ